MRLASLYGACIDFPVRVDATGTFVTTNDPETIISQAIADLIETLRGECVPCMLPNYGISNWIFDVMDVTFVARITHEIVKQIDNYVPNIRDLKVTGATDDQGRAVLNVRYRLVDQFDAPKNLVYPIWQLREQ